jgi:hypothetical protein
VEQTYSRVGLWSLRGHYVTEQTAVAPTRSKARFTGAVYLVYFLTAILAQVLLGRRLIVYGNAVNLIAFALYAAVTVRFYLLFKPVNRILSLLAAILSLVGCTIGSLSVFHLAPPNLSAFLFFGPYCIFVGYLILKSTFLPRFLGVLMVLAGLGWLIFLSPSLPNSIANAIEALGVLAEASLMLWLLLMGVNERRWNEQANRPEPA